MRRNEAARPRVLLCENDAVLVELLVDVFSDEGIDVTQCAALEDIHAGLDAFPDAVVVSDSWTGCVRPELSGEEQLAITDVAERAPVILISSRLWTQHAAGLALGDRVTVIPKPFDLNVLIGAVRGWALENSNL